MKFADMHGLVWELSGKQTSGKNMAGLHCYDCWPCFSVHADCTLHMLLLASRAICCYPGTVDRHSDDYVTTFNCVGCLWRRRSQALVIQTMRLRCLPHACSCVTITNRTVNTGTGNWIQIY